MTSREDEGGIQHCLPTLGFAGLERCSECPHGIHTHCRPGLQQWQQSPDTVRPPTTTRMSTSVCQAGRKTHGLQQGPYPQCSSPIPGPGRAPRLLPPRSGALWGAANRVTRPGFLNAAQHTHTLGEFLTAVSEQERWFISCAWPGNGPG